MNGDIRFYTNSFSTKLFRTLERAHGAKGIVALIKLQCYVATQAWTGVLHGVDEAEIERRAEWRGRRGAFANLLLELGELAHTDDGMLMVNWVEQQPYCAQAEQRAEQSRRAAGIRWEKERARRASA